MRCGRAITLLPASFLLSSLQGSRRCLQGRLHGLQTANRPLCTGRSRRSRRSRRSCDRNDRGVGLSPGARNTIRDSRLDVKSCRRHATLTGGWIARWRRAHLHHRRVTRLFTAQCALDCSLFEWCFGRRARARRDDRLDRSTAPHRTAPHRTGGPDVAVRTVLARTLMLTSHPPTHNREPHDTLSTPGGGARGKAAAEALLNLTWCTPYSRSIAWLASLPSFVRGSRTKQHRFRPVSELGGRWPGAGHIVF